MTGAAKQWISNSIMYIRSDWTFRVLCSVVPLEIPDGWVLDLTVPKYGILPLGKSLSKQNTPKKSVDSNLSLYRVWIYWNIE